MTAVSLSMNRGVDGFKLTDFTISTNAPGTGDIELRYNLTDQNGANLTRQDIIKALKAFKRVLEEGQLITNAPPL